MANKKIILPGLLIASLAFNAFLLAKDKFAKTKTLSSGNTSPNPATVTSKQADLDLNRNVNPTPLNSTNFDWAELEGMDDDSFVDSLGSLGVPKSMVHQFALGRITASHRNAEEELFFEKPFWKDISDDLTKLNEASRTKMEAISRKVLGDPYAGLDSVEKVRRQFGVKKWTLSSPRFQEGASTLYHMQLDQIEADELNALSNLLTEDQLKDYQIKNSWRTRQMASLLKLMEPGEEEFLHVMNAEMEKKVLDEAMSIGTPWTDSTFNEDLWMSQEALLDDLTENLGEERFQEYNRTQLPAYGSVRALQDQFGLSNEVVHEILGVRMGMQQQLMNGLVGFPDDKGALKKHKERIQSLLSDEAYQSLKRHASYAFPRGFFKE